MLKRAFPFSQGLRSHDQLGLRDSRVDAGCEYAALVFLQGCPSPGRGLFLPQSLGQACHLQGKPLVGNT